MAFFVTEPCINCKYGDCVEVCPVDCFYKGSNMLVIHPDECIDCGLCVPECPVNAIFSYDDLPSSQSKFIKINSKFSKVWPNITKKCKPYPKAEKWKNIKDKLKYLKEN